MQTANKERGCRDMGLEASHSFRSYILGLCEAPRKAIIYILKRMTFILTVPFQIFCCVFPGGTRDIESLV